MKFGHNKIFLMLMMRESYRVDKDFKNSSDQNVICPLVNSYFEKIDFPEDTEQFLNNLYEQIKPNLQIIKIK